MCPLSVVAGQAHPERWDSEEAKWDARRAVHYFEELKRLAPQQRKISPTQLFISHISAASARRDLIDNLGAIKAWKEAAAAFPEFAEPLFYIGQPAVSCMHTLCDYRADVYMYE